MMWHDMSPGELERQYSPSSCVDNFDALIAEYRDRSRKAEQVGHVIKDIRYGAAVSECLDLFPPDNSGTPLLVFIHGGYWQALSKEDSTFAGAKLAHKGIAFAAVDYTIAPQGTIEQMVNQCVNSIVWLHSNAGKYGFSANAIHIAGSSAGAHLAAMAAIKLGNSDEIRAPVKSLTLLSGIYDLQPIVATYINEPLHLDTARARALSPMYLDVSRLPGTTLCWGSNETSEFKRQSGDFAAHCAEAGVNVNAFEMHGYNHFDIVYALEDLAIENDQLTIMRDLQT
jgi:arylformamidase